MDGPYALNQTYYQQTDAHWGDSQVTGRGLLALVGKGQIYQLVLKDGEEYVAHPSNVVAYTLTQHPPLPYRLKSSSLRFEVPRINIGGIIPDTKLFQFMRGSGIWKFVTSFLFTLRTWSRRTIWGDRLFLQFHGPTTILLQTRAARLSDVLTTIDIDEIADTPAGVVKERITLAPQNGAEDSLQSLKAPIPIADKPIRLSVATIGKDGKVKFEETNDFSSVSK
ncbi:Altered inheritance of mitochondria protein 24, mitochondrial [Ptychographa xylographoides]|nr:Altered inheritance of mitochondria protein 24, mitochondrial [Ptychographa xylographoides]